MNIKIKEGWHLSNQLVALPRFGLFNNGEVVCKVTFTDSCRYTLTDGDQEDWNKLSCGASWGFFPLVKQYMAHENSSRWGWRYNPKTDKIEVTPYFYVNGERNYAETLGIKPIELEIGKKYELIIRPYKGYVAYTIRPKDEIILWCKRFDQNVPSTLGWNLPAYFGGTKPAPHRIEYELTYL